MIVSKNKDNVDNMIAIRGDLSEQSFQEVDSVNKIVDEKTKHIEFFNNTIVRNQQVFNKGLER